MIKIITLNRTDAQAAMNAFMESDGKLIPEVNNDYAIIRYEIQKMHKAVMYEMDPDALDKYLYDTQMAIRLYKYFEKQDWFSLRVASDEGFWRYLSLIVVPDIVGQRWGITNEGHFWKQPTRIWLRELWWYIYLSWQGSIEDTDRLICKARFSTDTIQNLVERVGKKGTYCETYRYIMYYFGKVPEKVLEGFSKKSKKKKYDLFRTVMILHTAKSMVIEPDLYPGGPKGYARSLFLDSGVEV